ncbi:MAG: hypothetical protein ACLR8Y_07640 [Alistipes indistinctus]
MDNYNNNYQQDYNQGYNQGHDPGMTCARSPAAADPAAKSRSKRGSRSRIVDPGRDPRRAVGTSISRAGQTRCRPTTPKLATTLTARLTMSDARQLRHASAPRTTTCSRKHLTTERFRERPLCCSKRWKKLVGTRPHAPQIGSDYR